MVFRLGVMLSARAWAYRYVILSSGPYPGRWGEVVPHPFWSGYAVRYPDTPKLGGGHVARADPDDVVLALCSDSDLFASGAFELPTLGLAALAGSASLGINTESVDTPRPQNPES